MKKLLAITLLACSTFATAVEDVPYISLDQADIPAYEALNAINIICGSSVIADQLINPNKKVSFNFKDIPCETAINLLLKFDKTQS